MVKKAAGRPLVLVNPLLADRPSGNNLMQVHNDKGMERVLIEYG